MDDSQPSLDLAERGSRLVQAAAAVLVLLSAITIAAYVVRIGPEKLPQQLMRFVLTLGLGYALIQGRQWARWLTLALVLLALLAVAPGILVSGAFEGSRLGGTLLLLGMAALYTWVGRLMLWSPSVAAFFRGRKAINRSAGDQPV